MSSQVASTLKRAMVSSQFARRTVSVSQRSLVAALSTSSSQATYSSPYTDLFLNMQNKSPWVKDTTTASSIISTSEEDATKDIPTLKCGISEHVLGFKTTCYDRLVLPPYVQKSEYKVTLQVKMKDLTIETDLEKEIFLQIVGSRFSTKNNTLNLTSNQFASRIENKRHLCWMLDRIIIGAKRLAAEMN